MKHKAKRPRSHILGKSAPPRGAVDGLRELPAPALVETINIMLGILQERGYTAVDWEDKSRALRKLSFLGGKPYAMLTREEADDGQH